MSGIRRALEPRVLLDAAGLETLLTTTAEPTLDNGASDPGQWLDRLHDLNTLAITEVIFVDGTLDDAAALASSLEAEGRLVALLDTERDGLTQIRETLAGLEGLAGIQVISHGADGTLRLGNLVLNRMVAEARAEDFAAIGASLRTGGDVLLYGCDVAMSDQGRQFIDRLAELTGADVAASEDLTGISGNWELEYSTGSIEVATPALLFSYIGDLALEGMYSDSEIGPPDSQFGRYIDADGEWVVAGGQSGQEVRVWLLDEDGVTRTEQTLDIPATADGSFGRGVAIYIGPMRGGAAGGELIVASPTANRIHIYQLDTSTNTWIYRTDVNFALVSGLNGNIGGWDNDFSRGKYLDINNGRIVVGAPNTNNNDGRIVWVIDDSATGNWGSINYTTGGGDSVADVGVISSPGFNDTESRARFGAAVAIAGNYIAIGAPEADTQSTSWSGDDYAMGAVIIYNWNESNVGITTGTGPTGTGFTRIQPNEWQYRFGGALDMDYDGVNYTLAVGAPGGESSGWGYNENRGMLYIYQSSNIATPGSARIINGFTGTNDVRFGASVAVNEGRILVGAGRPNNLNDSSSVAWMFQAANGLWGNGTVSLGSLTGTGNNIRANSFVADVPSAFPDSKPYVSWSNELGVTVSARPGWALGLTDSGKVAIGAPQDGGGGQVILHEVRPHPDYIVDGTSTNQQLGRFLAAHGDWVVSGGNTGSVTLWQMSGIGDMRNEIVISAGSIGAGSTFGQGVAIYGDEMVVAAPGDGGAGRLYVFQREGTSWIYRAVIDVASIQNSSGSLWGSARIGVWNDVRAGNNYLSINNGRIVVGAPNEGSNTGRVAWILDDSPNRNWGTINYALGDAQNGKRDAGFFDEPGGYSGDSSPRFGTSLSLAGDYIAIGAPGADLGDGWNGNHGAVFVYNWSASQADNGDGITTGSFTRLDGQGNVGSLQQNSYFGAAVAMEYDGERYTLVGGAPGEESGRGEIYIYQGSTPTGSTFINSWVNIYGMGSANNSHFGASVSINDSRITVGAGAPNVLTNSQPVSWFFESANNDWSFVKNQDRQAQNLGDRVNVYAFTAHNLSSTTAELAGKSVIAVANGAFLAIAAPGSDIGATDTGRVVFRAMRTPIAFNDSYVITEDTISATFDILANDIFGRETLPGSVTLELLGGTQQGGGSFFWNFFEKTLSYSPNTDYQYLAAGEQATVTINYRLVDLNSAWRSQATVTITITGLNDAVTSGAGISDLTLPQSNESSNSGAGGNFATPVSGNFSLGANTFLDVDVSDDIFYNLFSVAQVAGPASTAPSISITKTGFRTGNLAYNLSGVTPDTEWVITVRGSDRDNPADPNYTFHDTAFRLVVARTNESPEQISVVPLQQTHEDAPYYYDVSQHFDDPDLHKTGSPWESWPEELTFSIQSWSGPGDSWLSITPEGEIFGVPDNDNAMGNGSGGSYWGTHTIVIRATDAFGNYVDSAPITIEVINVNTAPVLVKPLSSALVQQGQTFSFNIDGSQSNSNNLNGPFFADVDPTGDIITYTAQRLDGTPITTTSGGSGTGSWIRFDGQSFTSAGSVNDPPGTSFTVRLIATDNHGASTAVLFDIGVVADADSATEIISGPGALGGDHLGFSSTISANGQWAAFGAPHTGSSDTGAVQIFENVSGSWVHRQTLTVAIAGAEFGTAVSLSDDGSRLVVGAPGVNSNRGALYYYQRSGSTYSATYYRSVGDTNGARLGSAVAMSSDGWEILAGAPGHSSGAGQAYLFEFDTTDAFRVYRPQTESGEASAAGDGFGYSVAFDQNMLLIGSPWDNHSGFNNAGSAYLISRDTGSLTKLTKAGAIASGDLFGWSVSLDIYDMGHSALLAIGSPGDDTATVNAGGVYLFRSDNLLRDDHDGDGRLGSIHYQSTLYANDFSSTLGFGYSVSLNVLGDNADNGIYMAIGADVQTGTGGAVYAYHYVDSFAGGWLGQRFAAPGVDSNAGFGHSVSIGGQWIVAGAPYADRGAEIDAGRVYTINLSTAAILPGGFSDSSTIKRLSSGMGADHDQSILANQISQDLLRAAGIAPRTFILSGQDGFARGLADDAQGGVTRISMLDELLDDIRSEEVLLKYQSALCDSDDICDETNHEAQRSDTVDLAIALDRATNRHYYNARSWLERLTDLGE
jgi:VCBS repeat-containing protein